MTDTLIANLPILGELLILVVAIGFGIQQIRSMNRLKREREAREAAESSADRPESDRKAD